MTNAKSRLQEAESKAIALFQEIEKRGLITAGKTEKELGKEIFDLALELYAIKKYWHKRIVRTGPNTLKPYRENPPNLTIAEDDILFIDFGPVFEDWEADIGRTYVLGNDPLKIKLKKDVEHAWYEIKKWVDQQAALTGAELYDFIMKTTEEYGWTYGGNMAGHLIGEFPHEKLDPDNYRFYIHPDNHNDLFAPDEEGKKRHWILEIHFVDKEKEIGGFYEQLLR